MKNNTTTAVYGDNFVGRKNEIEEATYRLEQENSIALFGLRRIGKSSVLQELNRIFKNKKYSTINIDCQVIQTPEAFLMEIFKKLPNKNIVIDFLKDMPKPVIEKLILNSSNPEAEISFKKDIVNYFEEISNALEKTINENKKIILFLDELPYFFENIIDSNHKISDIKRILTMLRFWRNSGISMAICGSIQIEYFLDSVEISRKLLSGLNTIKIGVFSKEESFELLDELSISNNVEIEDKDKETILELIGDWTPFFIQSYFTFYKLNKPKTKDDLIALYNEKVFSNVGKDFLSQFDERFSKFNQKEIVFIEKVFNFIGENIFVNIKDLKAKINDFQEEVFLKLLAQEFIIKTNENISFSFNIVQKWWLRK
jgi:hypothetical protein